MVRKQRLRLQPVLDRQKRRSVVVQFLEGTAHAARILRVADVELGEIGQHRAQAIVQQHVLGGGEVEGRAHFAGEVQPRGTLRAEQRGALFGVETR